MDLRNRDKIDEIYEKYKDDWRITYQPDYLYNITLKYEKFKQVKKHWDHEHCKFCWERISENIGDLNYGYCSLDNANWICEQCFQDFRDAFNWKVIESDA